MRAGITAGLYLIEMGTAKLTILLNCLATSRSSLLAVTQTALLPSPFLISRQVAGRAMASSILETIFDRLRLWIDSNHNGVSEPGELHTLREVGTSWINLKYYVSAYVDP